MDLIATGIRDPIPAEALLAIANAIKRLPLTLRGTKNGFYLIKFYESKARKVGVYKGISLEIAHNIDYKLNRYIKRRPAFQASSKLVAAESPENKNVQEFL